MPFETIITVGLNPTIDRVIEVPGLRLGEHLKGRTRSLMPAGKAFNVSRALAALGAANRAMGFLGRESVDLFDLSARLLGVETRWTPISARTRENLTLVDPIAGMATHIRDAGPTVDLEDLQRLTTDLEASCHRGTLVVFCGSLPQGLMPDDFGALIDACISRGSAVAVDASGEALQRASRSPLWLIKPNREELAELLGHPIAGQEAIITAGRALAGQIPLVLITSGSEGAYGFAEDHCCRARLQLAPELIRSTVGCGDTFLAGFIAAHQNGEPLESALTHATAVAAASAMSDLPASFAEQDRVSLLPQVAVEMIGNQT